MKVEKRSRILFEGYARAHPAIQSAMANGMGINEAVLFVKENDPSVIDEIVKRTQDSLAAGHKIAHTYKGMYGDTLSDESTRPFDGSPSALAAEGKDTWWSMTVPAHGERPDQGVKLGSWNGGVLGDRAAKKAAKAMGHAYISARGPGQPRLVKSRGLLEGSFDLTFTEEAARRLGDFLEAQFGNGVGPDGSRIIIPEWVGWQSARAEVASVAGVMDDAVIQARLAMEGAERGTPEEEQARALYGAELDRVLLANHLLESAEAVHDEFFSSDLLG